MTAAGHSLAISAWNRTAPSPMTAIGCPATSDRQRASVAAGVPTVGPSIAFKRALLYRRAAVTLVQRGEDVAAMRVHPRANQRAFRKIAARRMRERLQRRHGDDAPAVNEGQPLDGRDADPQPGERSRPGCDGVQIDRRQRPVVRVRERDDFARHPQGVRAGAIADPFVDEPIVLDQRGAAGARRGIEREYSHI